MHHRARVLQYVSTSCVCASYLQSICVSVCVCVWHLFNFLYQYEVFDSQHGTIVYLHLTGKCKKLSKNSREVPTNHPFLAQSAQRGEGCCRKTGIAHHLGIPTRWQWKGAFSALASKHCNEENPKGHGFQVKINRRYFGKGMKRTSNYTYKARSPSYSSYSLETLRVHADTACFKGADGPKGSPLGLYLKMYTMSFSASSESV